MEEADKFDPRICIICQERSKTPVTSEKTGRERLKRAAMIRNDDVAKRLKTMVDEQDDGEDSDNLAFVYHNSKTNVTSPTRIPESSKLLRRKLQLSKIKALNKNHRKQKQLNRENHFVAMLQNLNLRALTRIPTNYPVLFVERSSTRTLV